MQRNNLLIKRLDSVNLNWFLAYVRGQQNRMDNGTMWYCTIVLSELYEICFRSPEHSCKQEIVPLPSKPTTCKTCAVGYWGRDTEKLRKSRRKCFKCLLNTWSPGADFMASGNRFQSVGPWKQIVFWRNEVRQNGGQILFFAWCCVNAFWRPCEGLVTQNRDQVIQNCIHICG